jgi:hypothetical protein
MVQEAPCMIIRINAASHELELLHVAAPGADASPWASILTVKTLTVGGATAKVGASAQIRHPRHNVIETLTSVA